MSIVNSAVSAAGGPADFATPVTSPRLPELIAQQIVDAIRAGTLARGDRLPTEQELARQFGVGRTTVREGLQKLQALGLVEVRKGLGAFVAAAPSVGPEEAHRIFTAWALEREIEIADLLEARLALESTAASMAAVRATPEDIALLEQINAEHAAATEAGSAARVVSSDERFHDALIAAAANPLLGKLYNFLVAELTDFRRKTLALPGAPERSVRGHGRIVEALRAADPRAARAATVDHLWVIYEDVMEARDDGMAPRPFPPHEALG